MSFGFGSSEAENLLQGRRRMEEGNSAGNRRPSLKRHPNFSNSVAWKDKLRENCCRRVRENRSHLLWKMRRLSPDADSFTREDFVKSAFQDIVSDEMNKMKDNPMKSDFEVPLSSDCLWEYDGPQAAYQGEPEEILLEMQRIFYEDLREEPTGPEHLISTWEDDEDEYLAHAVYEHMKLEQEQGCNRKTWCPVCKKGELQEGPQMIYCTHCQLKLKRDNEVDLDALSVRLAEVHTEHLDRGCKLRPKFCVETKFGLTALYILCEACGTFDVVM